MGKSNKSGGRIAVRWVKAHWPRNAGTPRGLLHYSTSLGLFFYVPRRFFGLFPSLPWSSAPHLRQFTWVCPKCPLRRPESFLRPFQSAGPPSLPSYLWTCRPSLPDLPAFGRLTVLRPG